MKEQKYDLEGLRPAEYVCEPDPRSTMYVRIDRTNGTSRPIELADHHELISAYALHAGVPQDLRASARAWPDHPAWMSEFIRILKQKAPLAQRETVANLV
jgi:protease I